METTNIKTETEELDLTFQSESGWVNHVHINVPKSIMDACREKDIDWEIEDIPVETDDYGSCIDYDDEDDEEVETELGLTMYNEEKSFSRGILIAGDNDLLVALLQEMFDDYYDQF